MHFIWRWRQICADLSQHYIFTIIVLPANNTILRKVHLGNWIVNSKQIKVKRNQALLHLILLINFVPTRTDFLITRTGHIWWISLCCDNWPCINRKRPLAFEDHYYYYYLCCCLAFSVIKCWSYCFTEKYCHLVCHIFIFYCSFS